MFHKWLIIVKSNFGIGLTDEEMLHLLAHQQHFSEGSGLYNARNCTYPKE